MNDSSFYSFCEEEDRKSLGIMAVDANNKKENVNSGRDGGRSSCDSTHRAVILTRKMQHDQQGRHYHNNNNETIHEEEYDDGGRRKRKDKHPSECPQRRSSFQLVHHYLKHCMSHAQLQPMIVG